MKRIKKVFLLLSFCILFVVFGIGASTRVNGEGEHVHTDACYTGHRHAKSGCLPAGDMSKQVICETDTSNSGNSTTVWIHIKCATCGKEILYAQGSMSTDYLSYCKYLVIQYKHFSSTGEIITTYVNAPAGEISLPVPAGIERATNFIWGFTCATAYGNKLMNWQFGNIPLGFDVSQSMPWLGCPYCGKFGNNYSCGMAEDTIPDCVAPTISLSNMTPSTVLTEANTNFYPQIKIYDNENDILACKYYLDGSATATGTMSVTGTRPERVVTFPTGINASTLSEGAHTMKVTATDPYFLAGSATLTFYVDKSAPSLSSVGVTNSINSVKLDVSASDSVSGLAANAYRYTIGGVTTDWLTSCSFTKSGLAPNSTYAYTVEVRDSLGHIGTKTGSTYTKSDTPTISAAELEGGKVRIVVKDSNPIESMYRVQFGNQYADASGVLSQTASWFTLTADSSLGGKKIIIPNLPKNTIYTIIVSTKNNISNEIVIGNSATVITAPSTPSELTVNSTTNSNIALSWSVTQGAVYYELYRQTVAADGTVIATKTITDVITNYYKDSDVVANQKYLYSIRCKNQNNVYGNWAESPVTAMTLSNPPAKITGITAEADGSTLNISWNSMPEVLGYEVEVTCDGEVSKPRTDENNISFNTSIYNCQCSIRVRAFNETNGSDTADATLWKNAGVWSKEVEPFYTEANIPILDSINAVTKNSVEITWKVNDNPASVEYILGILKNGVIEEVAIKGENASDGKLTYSIKDLSSDTSYTFKLKAVSSNLAETDWSNELSATTLIKEPAVLTGLRATAKSDKITLSWNISERAQSYSIERNGTVIATNVTDTSYIDQEVTSNTEYTYKVMALNSTGDSGWSAPLVKKTLGDLPATPTITSASGSSISAVIIWTSVENVTGYDIEVDGNSYNVGLDTSYEDDGLTPGTYYAYKVRARNIYGKSDWSEKVTYYATPIAPDTPVNVTTSASGSCILISWNAIEGVSYYDVEIDSKIYSNILASEFSCIVSGENEIGSEHKIRVRAVNEGGESEWSESIITILTEEGNLPTIELPATPAIIECVSGSAIVAVTWNKVVGATQYQLEADDSIIYTGTNSSYIHTFLVEGSQHVYRIRAGNSSGFSDWSSPISVTTGLSGSTMPENISYYRISDSVTAIIWDKEANVNGYRIEINGATSEGVISDTFTEIATTPGTQYTIRIASLLENEELDWSDEMVFRAPSGLPNTTEIESVKASSDTIKVSWKEVAGASEYEIDINGETIDVDNVLSYNITNLAASTSYTLQVRAHNESGAGNWSKAQTIMTNEGIAGVPINIKAIVTAPVSTATGSAIKITWDKVEGATSYEVEDSSGKVYLTETNTIVIQDLTPGEKYYYRVRALSETDTGAWSSRISFVPQVSVPTGVAATLVNGAVRISWDKVGGAGYYEIELNGITYTITDNTSINLDGDLFYLKRAIRVRACYGTQKSEWSEIVTFGQSIPVTTEVTESEKISVVLPYKNVDVSEYKLILIYDSTELELLDACELTSALETSSTYISEFGTHVVITKNGNMVSITFIMDEDGSNSLTGIASSIKFKSKITGTVTLQYGVTEK